MRIFNIGKHLFPLLLLLSWTQLVYADSVAQVQTTKYFAPETVAMIKQRVQDVADGVPGATLGFKAGDTVSYIIQFTPIANTSTIGAGGYITDYIPAGVVVTSASFVEPDGAGGFYSVAPPTSAQMATDNAMSAFAGWVMDAPTLAICTAQGRTAANCSGRFANLVADTGIFYSTDPRTAVFSEPSTDGRVRQWDPLVGGNGYYVLPERGRTQLPPKMSAPVGALPTTHNYWDAAMTTAFGTRNTSVVNAPTASTIARMNTNGTGAAPFNAGSPVAGPDTGYQLDYTGQVGPWQRISYLGSTKGVLGLPATGVVGANGIVGMPTAAGALFPLPPTTNAVRWAAGRLVVGSQSHVKISVQLTSAPPATGLVNNSEVFGGDGSPESGLAPAPGGNGNVDNPWTYHVPSVASNVSTLFVLKNIVCVYDANNTCVPNNGANLPIAGSGGLGPKVRYRISYINTNNGTQHNVTVCDQLPDGATLTPAAAQVNFATGVTQVNAVPNIGAPVSPAAAVCGFAAGGTTFSYPTIPVLAGGGAGVLEFDVQFPLFAAGNAGDAIVNTAKVISTEIPSGVVSYVPSNLVASTSANLIIGKVVNPNTPSKGDTVTYSITVANTGITAANLTTLVDVLPGQATAVVLNQVPSRFNYVATNSIVINGVPVSGATVVVTPPAAPATTNSETITWTFPPGTTIPAGQQMVVTFTATAGGTLATNVMLYGTAYSNTATINCSANCVTTPAIAATKTTGLTAAATLTAPNLQLLKTIDCVFDGLGVCAPGSYLVGSSIPVSAKLRYKIDYTNPESAAQTITLTDTLPAKTTAAGNLYVASGPDIRPSAPVLSVNPAAAGAPRGVDAALTAIAASTVVNFTAASLPAGSSGTLYVDVQNNATTGVTTNTASINSTQRVAAGGAAVTSAVSATAAALTITKTSNVSTIGPGGNVIYTVTVTNPGAVGVVLTNVVDTLPKPLPNLAGRTILCATSVATCLATTTVTINGVAAAAPTLAQTAPTATVGQINTWTLAGTAAARTLNPGQTMVLSFTATYSATVLPGNTYSNTATSNYTGGTTTTGLVAPVTVPYNTISVSKAVASPISASIAPNSPVTYAITVTNTGATNVPITSVVDSLPAATVGTIAYTSTTSVLVNGIAQTGVAGAPVGAQYTNPAPLAAVPGVQQAVTWTFPAAGTTVINPGQTMVITFVAQYGAVPTGVTYFNDVVANYTGGATTSESVSNVAPVSVPPLSKITKTIDCIYNPTCAAGTYVDGTPIPVNAKLGYKIVYENLSATPASGIIVTDTLPTQTGANSISNLVVNGTPTAAPPSAGGGATVTLLTGGTLPALGSGIITFAVQTTATAGAGVTNTGKMTSTQDPLGVTSLATAAAAGGNLTVSKAVTPATSSTVAQGGVVSYTISVKNDGSASATLTSLADTLPGTPAAAPGTTSRFTYTATGAITLNGVAIAPAFTTVVTPPAVPATTNKETVTWTFTGGVVIPAGQTFKLTFTATVGTLVSKGAAAPGITYYNDIVANYTGGAFPSASVSSQAPVLVPFDTLTMSKTIDCVYDAAAIPVCQPYTLGAPIPAAAKLRYRLAYDNISPTAQVVTIKDTLPTAVTAAGNLYVGSGPNVRPSTPALSQNAALAGAPRGPDVALTAIAGGTVVAMTAVSLPGSSSGTLFLDVQTNALSGATVSNCASISTVAANNCATPGVVSSTSTVSVQNAAVLNISKTTSTPTLTPGGTATYTISITNNGTAATQSLKVYDFLPYSGGVVDATKRVAYVAASSVYSGGLPVPTITTSVAPTVSPYASDPNQQQVLWDFGAYALPIGATVTVTFNATVGANMPGGSYYNSVRYEQTSAGINFSANADAQALIAVSSAQPSLTLLKMVNPFWDPFNGTPDPLVFAPDAKNIPGAIVEYTVIATNSGTGPADNNSIVITDPIPADGSLFVNPISGGLAVILTNGATASGLTIPLTAADIDFFGGSPTPGWGYVPVAGADGCDPLVSSLKVNPKGIFVGNPTPPSPSFNLKFRVCVK